MTLQERLLELQNKCNNLSYDEYSKEVTKCNNKACLIVGEFGCPKYDILINLKEAYNNLELRYLTYYQCMIEDWELIPLGIMQDTGSIYKNYDIVRY